LKRAITAAANSNSAADAALGGKVAHQDEQRDHAQVVAGETREGLGVEEVGQRQPAGLQ
jgi:hypothetical protein